MLGCNVGKRKVIQPTAQQAVHHQAAGRKCDAEGGEKGGRVGIGRPGGRARREEGGGEGGLRGRDVEETAAEEAQGRSFV